LPHFATSRLDRQRAQGLLDQAHPAREARSARKINRSVFG
jgi:hypothetical protein